MKKTFLLTAVIITLVVLVAGMYKFNILASKQGYDVDGNKIENTTQAFNYYANNGEFIEVIYYSNDTVEVHFMQFSDVHLKAFTAKLARSASGSRYISNDKSFIFWAKGNEATIFDKNENILFSGELKQQTKNTQQGKETLYFDPITKTWHDEIGICNSCTAVNGFTQNGQITSAPLRVQWQTLFFTLKNDLNENPPIAEVKQLFTEQYSALPNWFATHVSLDNNVYRIIIATDRDIDFMDRTGALKATYTVEQLNP